MASGPSGQEYSVMLMLRRTVPPSARGSVTTSTLGVKLLDVNALDIYELRYPGAVGPPGTRPIGLNLAGTAKAVSRAFDARLAAAGGSVPIWLILSSGKRGPAGSH